MDTVDINAGTCYLRELRADDLLDDRPALVEAFADPQHRRYVPYLRVADLTGADEYIAMRRRERAAGSRCSWAIAEPVTGGLLGEVGLKDIRDGRAEVSIWVHPSARGRGLAVTAVSAALRFGFGALGLTDVRYFHEEDNAASAAVARSCGFLRLDGEDVALPAGEHMIAWAVSSRAR